MCMCEWLSMNVCIFLCMYICVYVCVCICVSVYVHVLMLGIGLHSVAYVIVSV
jgi:hypothetical protein